MRARSGSEVCSTNISLRKPDCWTNKQRLELDGGSDTPLGQELGERKQKKRRLLKIGKLGAKMVRDREKRGLRMSCERERENDDAFFPLVVFFPPLFSPILSPTPWPWRSLLISGGLAESRTLGMPHTCARDWDGEGGKKVTVSRDCIKQPT